MLGEYIYDIYGAEDKGELRGMGLLPTKTYFEEEKTRTRVEGVTGELLGELQSLSRKKVSGYEIHMGRTISGEDAAGLQWIGAGCYQGHVMGTYLHGIFDEEDFRSAFVQLLCRRKGIAYRKGEIVSYQEYKQQQFDRLAQELREHLDIQEIYRIMGMEV